MKKEDKKKKGSFGINGVKGAISLFMAVLMTPFLTIAMLLVETGRLNSAVSIMDELLGVTSMSTLANYDDYLQERWGLLAVAQDQDVNTVFSDYLDVNTQVMNGAFTVNNIKTSGIYPLSDKAVLEEQLMEYCKLNAPTKLGSEIVSKVTSMLDFMEKLKKGLNTAGNIASLLTNGVNTLDSGITMAKSAKELKKSAKALDDLKEDFGNHYDNFRDETNALIDNLKDKEELEKEVAPLKEELKTLQSELSALKKKEPQTDAVKSSIKAKEKEIEEKEKEIDPYQEDIDELTKTISKNRETAEKARSTYETTIDSIAKEMKNFQEHMSKCDEAILSIEKNIEGAVSDGIKVAADLKKKRGDLENTQKDVTAMKESLENWDGATDAPAYVSAQAIYEGKVEELEQLQTEVGQLETAQKIADTAQTGIGEMGDSFKKTSDGYSDAVLGETIKGFEALHKKVKNFKISSVTGSTDKVTAEAYKGISVKGYIKADEIQDYLDDQEKKLKEGSLKGLMDGLLAIYNQLMGFSIFFEAKLDAQIDMQYYTQNFGGLPGGEDAENPILEIMKNIGNICKSGVNFVDNLKDLDLLGMLEDLKTIVENVIDLFENIGKVVLNFLTNIAEAFTSYEKYYLTTYNAYNLACRTDYSDATSSTSLTTISGYSVGEDSFNDVTNYPNIPVFGEIAALIQTIVTAITNKGKDIMFNGAELEYMLFGSTSEVANQLYVFVVLYLIRLLSSIPAITADADVQSLAASTTLGYPVVIALYIFLEPLVQTVLLVNGKDQPLIPTEVYLSPSGLPKLVSELMWFCKLTTQQSEALTKSMVSALESEEGKYDIQSELYKYEQRENPTTQKLKLSLDFSYKDYCLVLLLLTVTKEQQIARLSNLIQMETLCYYRHKGVDYTFDLRESYTFLESEVDFSVNQIMPSLIDSSWFKVSRKHYRGY